METYRICANLYSRFRANSGNSDYTEPYGLASPFGGGRIDWNVYFFMEARSFGVNNKSRTFIGVAGLVCLSWLMPNTSVAAEFNSRCIIASPSRHAMFGLGESAKSLPYLQEFLDYYFPTRCNSTPTIIDASSALEQSGSRVILCTAKEAASLQAGLKLGATTEDGFVLKSAEDAKGIVVWCVGNSIAGVKRGLYRLILESVYENRTLSVPKILDLRVNPFMPQRAVVPGPAGPVSGGSDFATNQKFNLYMWDPSKIDAWIRLYDYFGFNVLENPMADAIALDKTSPWAAICPKAVDVGLYMAKCNRHVGNRTFQFVWGAYPYDPAKAQFRFACFNTTEGRAILLSWYDILAKQYAPLSDGLITHWADPGGCRGAKCTCDVRTPQQLHLKILKAFQKYNPNLKESYFSLWFCSPTVNGRDGGYWSWRNTTGLSDFTNSAILPKEVGILVGLAGYGAPGPAEIGAIVAARRKAGLWRWYFCDNEVTPGLYMNHKPVDQALSLLTRTIQRGGMSWDQCEVNRHGDWNAMTSYIGAARLLDPSLDAERLSREVLRRLGR